MDGIIMNKTIEINIQQDNIEVLEKDLKYKFKNGIKKVLFINPPDADSSIFKMDVAKRGRYPNYPAYGLGILSTNLREINIDTSILNLTHYILKHVNEYETLEDLNYDKFWQDRLEKEILEFSPDLICVTCMFSMTHKSFSNVCEFIDQFNLPLAVGGVHISNEVERIINEIPSIDFAFTHEGDVSLRNFVNYINEKETIDSLAQIYFRLNDIIYCSKKMVRPTSVDISKLPAYDQMDIENHSKYGVIGSFYFLTKENTKIASILSNRGCRARCSFCSVHSFNGEGVVQRSITSVVDEMQLLKEKYGITHFMWLDDDLLKGTQRTLDLFNEITRRKLNITWDATNGVIATSCTPDIIEAAAKSGCIAINIGVETGSAKILKEVRKPANIEIFLKAAEVLKGFDQIHTSIFLMIGFPNETFSMIQETIDLAQKMDMDWYRISTLNLLPGTPMYESMVAAGTVKDEDIRFNGGAFGKQSEIEQGVKKATNSFQEVFNSIGSNDIPNDSDLTDIWFFMNYHLNFKRLFNENRPVKIEQQLSNLKAISDILAPENGFALYFYVYLLKKYKNIIDYETINRLEKRLQTSDYWKDRFDSFGLRIEDLYNTGEKSE